MGPRKELGFRTVFNMIGPLLNPVGVDSQVMGVYAPEITETAAQVLDNLDVRHAYVVHGNDCLLDLRHRLHLVLVVVALIDQRNKGKVYLFEMLYLETLLYTSL